MLIFFLTLTVSGSLAAQVTDSRPPKPGERRAAPAPPRFDSWIRGQGFFFGNFFQASGGAPEEDVTALQGEIGTRYRLTQGSPLQAYGSVNYMSYDDDALDRSFGGRLGIRSEGNPHTFDVYFDRQMDRPTFDVGDEFDRADVSLLHGEYSYRVTRNWEAGVRGDFEKQEFDLTPVRDNEFAGLGATVRWRGSRVFSPEVGYYAGEREVDDPTQTYDQTDLFFQVRSALTPRVYWSARYRHRTRDYTTTLVEASSFGREDTRNQLSGYVDFVIVQGLNFTIYGSWEDVDSNLAGRDFDTSLLMGGLTYRF